VSWVTSSRVTWRRFWFLFLLVLFIVAAIVQSPVPRFKQEILTLAAAGCDQGGDNLRTLGTILGTRPRDFPAFALARALECPTTIP
jgi:hypothetical protein